MSIKELTTKVAVLEHFLYLGHWGFLSDSELGALFSKRRVLFNGVGGRGGGAGRMSGLSQQCSLSLSHTSGSMFHLFR